MNRLARQGIGTRPFFWPMHEQPVFRRMGIFDEVSCPIAERLARRGFYIPSGLHITESEIERIVESLNNLLDASEDCLTQLQVAAAGNI